jgi:hypothetical protein
MLASRIRLHVVRDAARQVRLSAIIALVFLLCAIQLYGMFRYGLFGSLSAVGKHAITFFTQRQVPYWYSSLRMIENYFLCAALFLTGAQFTDHATLYRKKIIIAALVTILLIIAYIEGRRILLYALIELVLINSSAWSGLFKPKLLIGVFASLVVIALASNMYQYYRTRIGEAPVTRILSHWDDFQLTTSNLRRRMPDWIGGYLMLAGNQRKEPMTGAILEQDIKNNIPYFLNPHKMWVYIKRPIGLYYDLHRSHGFPTTPSLELIGDWGVLGGLILGTFFYLILTTSAGLALVFFRREPFFQTLVAGGLAYILINVELDFYSSIFEYWKYLLILLALFLAYNSTKVLARLERSEVKPNSWTLD